MPWPSGIATMVVVVAGIAGLAAGTHGGSVWTAEAARRQAVLDDPLALPEYTLEDTRGETFTLAAGERELTVVDFVFTQCPTVCLSMGAQFRLLQSELAGAGLFARVQLVSVTFDPDNDDAVALAGYLSRFGAIEPDWRAAKFADDETLRAAMEQLGVIAIPQPDVGFVHNAAFYLIDDGEVVAIIDVDDRRGLLAAIERRLAR